MEDWLVPCVRIWSAVCVAGIFLCRRHSLFNFVFLCGFMVPLLWASVTLQLVRFDAQMDEHVVGHQMLRCVAFYAVLKLYDAYNVHWASAVPGSLMYTISSTYGLALLGVSFFFSRRIAAAAATNERH